ncbi:hypothetical protein HDF16_002780 [Granulicella aggregans]|uniref:Inner membrane protein YgaP-like transmembrane domain-containing protein n=1 Tax=Granulicella aggregans TaxID=474949 RepID=A0A7W7ZDU0_9BACT|nr:DUF2892 domain-containing protein [Granulicella aggregans]MBB5058074.1 hypothetical protein [Granulicella aggregans]
MLYRKNLPTWERFARIFGAIVLTTCAFHYGRNAVGITFGVAAIGTVLTGLVGYCPFCRIGGRKGIA